MTSRLPGSPGPEHMGIELQSALGRDFEAVPPHWVSVFRECSPDELERVAVEGLVVPPPELRPAEIRREMETLDRFRPALAERLGISRLRAIYAAPTAEDAPSLPFRRERIILEIKTDPALGFVGDMDFVTCLIPFIDAHRSDLDRFHGAFQKYWDSVITLTDFLYHYERTGTGPGRQWVVRDGSRPGLPRVYYAPEILLMTPAVSRHHLRVVGG